MIALSTCIAAFCTGCTMPNFLSFLKEVPAQQQSTAQQPTPHSPIRAAQSEPNANKNVAALLDPQQPDRPINRQVSNLWLAPNDNSEYLTPAFERGNHRKEFTGAHVEFIGASNDLLSFMVNIDDSLNFYDANTFDQLESFPARGCTEVTFSSLTYCANPELEEITVFDTHFREVHGTIPFPGNIANIRLLGSIENLDLVQIETTDQQDIIVAIADFHTVRWEAKIPPESHCGLTAQNTTVICSEQDGDTYRLSFINAFSGSTFHTTETKGKALTASHGWVEKTDDKLRYLGTDGAEYTHTTDPSSIVGDVFPWNTPLHTGDSSPQPPNELGFMVEKPLLLFDAAHVPVLRQIGNGSTPRVFSRPNSSTPVFTLYGGERVASLATNGHLVLAESEDSYFLKDLEAFKELYSSPKDINTELTINRGWFAVKQQVDASTQKVTVVVPVPE
ncbi:hypothetical protein CFREI_10475 [Corynebacterium freiburgense]|nr:hypothetical protein CFREI_10475 [Corynebacterium freiburgense]